MKKKKSHRIYKEYNFHIWIGMDIHLMPLRITILLKFYVDCLFKWPPFLLVINLFPFIPILNQSLCTVITYKIFFLWGLTLKINFIFLFLSRFTIAKNRIFLHIHFLTGFIFVYFFFFSYTIYLFIQTL